LTKDCVYDELAILNRQYSNIGVHHC